MTKERAIVLHNEAWARYMRAWRDNRAALARGGRTPYRVAQRFVETSEALGYAQGRLDLIDNYRRR
jgi:hypothetical protein